jgi:hypothetical protein
VGDRREERVPRLTNKLCIGSNPNLEVETVGCVVRDVGGRRGERVHRFNNKVCIRSNPK